MPASNAASRSPTTSSYAEALALWIKKVFTRSQPNILKKPFAASIEPLKAVGSVFSWEKIVMIFLPGQVGEKSGPNIGYSRSSQVFACPLMLQK